MCVAIQFRVIRVAVCLHHADDTRTSATAVAAKDHLRQRTISAGHRQTHPVSEASRSRLRYQSAAAAYKAAAAHRLYSAGTCSAATAYGLRATAADAGRTRAGPTLQLRASGQPGSIR